LIGLVLFLKQPVNVIPSSRSGIGILGVCLKVGSLIRL